MRNLPAEQQAITLILSGDIKLLHALEVEDFTEKRNAHLFETIKKVHNEESSVDFVRINQVISNDDQKYLMQLFNAPFGTPSEWINVLKSLKECRAIRNCSSFDPTKIPPAELPAEMIRIGLETSQLLDFRENDIERIKQSIENPKPRVEIGIEEIDKGLGGGLTNTSLCILAAKSGLGKSYMAAYIIAYALQNEKTVHCTSLEMSEEEVNVRVMKTLAGVFDSDVQKRVRELWTYEERFITQCRKGKLNEVLADMHKHSNADLFVVDYLGLVKDPTEKNNVIELGNISRAFKLFAQFHKKPVICLHQINRESIKAGRRPVCHDLRGSGQIEENADQVMFLWKEEPVSEMKDLAQQKEVSDHYALEDPYNQKILFYVDKNRHGGRPETEIKFDPRIGYSI